MSAPRRISDKHPGVFYREGAKGRRYEISYTDSDGVRRWKTVGGGQRAAVRALAEIRTRMGKGERVAPSRVTLREFGEAWMETHTTNLRPRTVERYEVSLRLHVFPLLGRLKLAEITEDHVAMLIRDMQEGRGLLPPDDEGKRAQRRKQSAWSIRAALTPLSRVLSHAVRRGMIPTNPVTKLERGERPTVTRREMRVFEKTEIGSLLGKAGDRYRAMLATALFTGLRLGELLALTWADVDFEAGVIRVRKQLARDGTRSEPKTPQAIRDVILTPALGKILREHRIGSGHSLGSDFVFASTVGTPMQARNVARRGLEQAMKDAKLNGAGKPKMRFHDCRHTFASLLIAEGRDPVFVSRQLGHANPAITMGVYAHLFDHERHAEQTRDELEASFGGLLEHAMETTGGDSLRTAVAAGEAKVAVLQAVRD